MHRSRSYIKLRDDKMFLIAARHAKRPSRRTAVTRKETSNHDARMAGIPGLGRYTTLFEENEVDFETLRALTENDLCLLNSITMPMA